VAGLENYAKTVSESGKTIVHLYTRGFELVVGSVILVYELCRSAKRMARNDSWSPFGGFSGETTKLRPESEATGMEPADEDDEDLGDALLEFTISA
jgi:hypothetical protein